MVQGNTANVIMLWVAWFEYGSTNFSCAVLFVLVFASSRFSLVTWTNILTWTFGRLNHLGRNLVSLIFLETVVFVYWYGLISLADA